MDTEPKSGAKRPTLGRRTRLRFFKFTMSFLDRPAAPPTKLGVYRILSPNAGVRVSPLQLGAGSIGDQCHKYGGLEGPAHNRDI
ncbi:unnamed protein product [Mycena citricolor]|uniref:Uncharacterized protein n=1 Tax=Mycena citricolor TaxID=2018698 RepID=A0AAD2GZD3_9AGAR|nr:unnamed protein product [Mycena citricolor]